ncbi:MAG: UbiA family prenyltransferase [Myxococcota bacterium]
MARRRNIFTEVRHFLIHLRLHYQLLVLPGGYLLGALYSSRIDWTGFFVQFICVHVFLNGGVTAYNSFWDKDEGPIGGIKAPPPMTPWMHPASLIVQLAGLVIAWPQGALFVGLYVATMLLSIAYSWPGLRWKGHPWLSLVSVGIGTGTNTFLMGYLAAGGPGLSARMVAAAFGVALLLLSLYPVSQVFQIEEDLARGDTTFAAKYGLAGVVRWFSVTYPIGLTIACACLYPVRPMLAIALGLVGTAGFGLNTFQVRRLTGAPDEYDRVMKLKYGASLSFVGFLVLCLVWIRL